MAQRNIDFGSFPDDPNADAIRSAFEKVQLNFTEVFAGLGDQAVVSVNKTAGAGISVNQPTGNVVITNKLACVTVQSSTLDLGLNTADTLSAVTLTSASQSVFVDLPSNIITGLVNLSLTGNLIAENIVSNANLTTANLVVSSTADFSTVPLSVLSLTSTGNISGGNLSVGATGIIAGDTVIVNNVYANAGVVKGTTLSGSLTTAAQPNITSVGTLTSLAVTANADSGNVNATGGVFTYVSGDGANLTAIPSGNITGQVANALVSGTVYTAAQPNITSVGTLSTLSVTGNVSAGNVSGTGGVFTYVSGDGANLTSLNGTNVTGAVSFATTANAVAGANVSGEVAFATTANAVAGANVSGTVASATLATTATTANAVAGANVSGAVSFATTANAVAGANVSGTVASATTAGSATTATTAGTVTTAAQPNITSVGTLLIHSSSDGISAAGSSQGTATALTSEINRVTSVTPFPVNEGVRLPTAQGGLIIFVTNTTANELKVYPNTSDAINSLGTNSVFAHPAGATLQYICTNATNWYTVGATYA